MKRSRIELIMESRLRDVGLFFRMLELLLDMGLVLRIKTERKLDGFHQEHSHLF